MLTDVYRVKMLEDKGYQVTATEFVSPLETPKNLLILAEKSEKKLSSQTGITEKIKQDFHLDPILEKLIF